MSASITRLLHQPERFGRLWWLPSGGEGNGLSDAAWAPIGEFRWGRSSAIARGTAGRGGACLCGACHLSATREAAQAARRRS
jgi:hypothetical protein